MHSNSLQQVLSRGRKPIALFAAAFVAGSVGLNVTPAEALYRRTPIGTSTAVPLDMTNDSSHYYFAFTDDSYFDHGGGIAAIWVDMYFYQSGKLYGSAAAMNYSGEYLSVNAALTFDGSSGTPKFVNGNLCSASCTTWANSGWYAWISISRVGGWSGGQVNGFFVTT